MATATASEAATRTRFSLAAMTRFEWGCTAAILAGVALRLLYLGTKDVSFDQAWYLTMARSLLDRGEFTLPWMGEPPVFTQHFPPVFPAWIAAFFAAMGTTMLAAHVATVMAGVALIVATFLCTWDLYGRERAFAVTAILATFHILVHYDARLQTESLVALFFVLTIWAILKSLDRPAFIVLAGLFAALGYLTKASMGVFFVLAGVAGFAWRFYYMRWQVLKNPWYLTAMGVFGLAVVAWGARNVARFGWPNWQTQKHASESFEVMLATPWWPWQMAKVTVWLLLVLALLAAPYAAELRKAARRPTLLEEATSGLWMGVVTPVVVAVFFVTAFTIAEDRPIVDYSSIRYVVTGFPVVLWLGFRRVDFGGAEPHALAEGAKRRGKYRAAVAVGVAMVAIVAAMNPARFVVTNSRVVLAVALYLAALVPFALALAWRGHVVTRTRAGGEREAKYVVDPHAGRDLLVVLALWAVGLYLSAYWMGMAFFPFAALAAMAVVVRDPKARVAAICVVFAGASLAYTLAALPVEDAAVQIRGIVPAGETVLVEDRFGQYYYPFLHDYDLRAVSLDDGTAEWYLWFEDRPGAEVGGGWTRVATFEPTYDIGPGTRALLVVEDALGTAPRPPDQPALVLHRRA